MASCIVSVSNQIIFLAVLVTASIVGSQNAILDWNTNISGSGSSNYTVPASSDFTRLAFVLRYTHSVTEETTMRVYREDQVSPIAIAFSGIQGGVGGFLPLYLCPTLWNATGTMPSLRLEIRAAGNWTLNTLKDSQPISLDAGSITLTLREGGNILTFTASPEDNEIRVGGRLFDSGENPLDVFYYCVEANACPLACQSLTSEELTGEFETEIVLKRDPSYEEPLVTGTYYLGIQKTRFSSSTNEFTAVLAMCKGKDCQPEVRDPGSSQPSPASRLSSFWLEWILGFVGRDLFQ